MGYGVERVYAKAEGDFIPPPSYGLWLFHRRSGGGEFTIFKDLPQMKAAVSRSMPGLVMTDDAFLYEFKGGQWVKFAEVLMGEKPKEHPLWKKPSKVGPGSLEVPAAEVDDAIESILTSVRN